VSAGLRGIRRCRRCVNPDTRPNIFFDESGLCPVCVFALKNEFGGIDWPGRRRELDEILRWGRARKKSSYDCIVPVSGGKDSTRQALYARDDLRLKPLLVSCVYPPEQLAERGALNISNLISLGFDTVTIGLDPQVWKALMRIGFRQFGNWARSTEMALYAIPIHAAIAYKIPLVFYGENPVWTIGERHGRLDGDASRLNQANTIRGGPASLLPPDVSRQSANFYHYPPEQEMVHAELRLVYLGYYIPDWSGHNNARFAVAHGLTVRQDPPEDIGDIWGFTSLDEDFRIVNQMLKYLKLGFGHVTDQVCEAISAGMMTREEGLELVRRYDGKCARRYVESFCRYLDITEREFWEVAESYRNQEIWSRVEGGDWTLADESRTGAANDA
jgi:N-acetyl sugar amidotransferase